MTEIYGCPSEENIVTKRGDKMNDFEYEVMQRKRLAHQASHRKRGSKSKKCPMSTDYMTKKQWIERCGDVMTYQLGKPMPWDDFKKMPSHIQKEYLLDMIKRYSTTASDLARMFGITAATMTRHCGTSEIDISFTPGKRMPKEKRNEFEKLLSGTSGEVEEVKESTNPPICDIDMSKSTASSNMAMTEFSLCFEGVICPETIANSLIAMIRPGANAKIEVKCSIVA